MLDHSPVPRITGLASQAAPLSRAGALQVRLANTPDELAAAQALRFDVFCKDRMAGGTSAPPYTMLDADEFDAICQHLIVTDGADADEKVVGTYRLIDAVTARARGGFYSEAEYDLAPLLAAASGQGRNLLELGRSCVAPAYRTSGTISLLWRGIAALCEEANVGYLFGCASFPGIDPAPHTDCLSLLHRSYRSPLSVRAVAERYVPMDRKARFDDLAAWRALPPLIRGYLQVGAMVGDGAVIDHDFGTVDVFVMLDTALIRDRYRRRFLRV